MRGGETHRKTPRRGSVSESGGHRGKVTRAPVSSGFSFRVFGKAFGREPVRAEEEGGWLGAGGGAVFPPHAKRGAV